MKDLIKTLGLSVISGAAVTAGMRIYDELLDEKVTLSIIKQKSKLKKRKRWGCGSFFYFSRLLQRVL